MKSFFSLFFVLALLTGQAPNAFAQKARPIDPELQKLKDNLAAARHDTARMMAYVAISLYFQNKIQLDSSLAYALKATKIANKYPDHPKIAKVWNKIGASYKLFIDLSYGNEKREYYDSLAQYYFKLAIKDAKRFGDEDIFLKSSFNLNLEFRNNNKHYLFLKGSFKLANYLESKNKYNSLDSIVLLKTYLSLCIALDYALNSRLHNKYLANAKKLIKTQGNDSEHLSVIEFEQNAAYWKKADEVNLLKNYQRLKKNLKDINFKEQIDFYLASYYFNIGEYNKSLQISSLYVPDKDLQKNLQLSFSALYFMNTGKCEYELGRNQEAVLHLSKALSFANQVESVEGLQLEKYTILSYLSHAHQKQGNYKQAYQYLTQADSLYKEIYDEQNQALMAENDVQLEEIRQEKKVQQARTQTLLKEQEIQIQKKQKYTFLAISILALLSAAWAVYSFIKTRKQNKIISQQAAALEESNQLKDKIFALLSHDLRSPINRLVVSLNNSIESQRTHIQAELKSVQDILNNVLYWASMQLKKAMPVYRDIPLQPLAESLIEEYTYALQEKNITFLNAIDRNCSVKTDEGYLKIVLRNLISNAIKFTPDQGFIQIGCQLNTQVAEITLRDTGVGIAAHRLDTLFQLPAPSRGTKQEKGSGLGLSLSADIISKLGGRLSIRSKEGKGTQVAITLPL